MPAPAAAPATLLASALLLLVLLVLPSGMHAFLVPTSASHGGASAGRPLQVQQRLVMDCSSISALLLPPLHRRRSVAALRMSEGMGEEEEMILTPENAELALELARKELGTLFGYLKENQEVGITGKVDFVDLDGVAVIVDLKGRFWHDRRMVLARVEKFIQNRIPECFEVRVRDPRQLEAGNDDKESVEQFYRN